MKKEKFVLVIVLVFVVVAIWYLERQKVHPVSPGPGAQSIAITATSTPVVSAGATSSAPMPSGSRSTLTLAALAAEDQQAGYSPAIEIVDPTGFVNVSSSFRLRDLIGKEPFLLDFWTYSCINCLRTIPYLNAWYGRYHSQGLEIVGIHTPEFDFEKDIANVSAAVAKYGIQYPVVLDSDYGTWNAYNNLYWPHEYLVDMAGYIVHDQVGEGNYAETEGAIQKVLGPARHDPRYRAGRDADLDGFRLFERHFCGIAYEPRNVFRVCAERISCEWYCGQCRRRDPGSYNTKDREREQPLSRRQMELYGPVRDEHGDGNGDRISVSSRQGIYRGQCAAGRDRRGSAGWQAGDERRGIGRRERQGIHQGKPPL